jgi:hypothetical protein
MPSPARAKRSRHRATTPALPQLVHPCTRHALAMWTPLRACRPRLTASQGDEEQRQPQPQPPKPRRGSLRAFLSLTHRRTGAGRSCGLIRSRCATATAKLKRERCRSDYVPWMLVRRCVENQFGVDSRQGTLQFARTKSALRRGRCTSPGITGSCSIGPLMGVIGRNRCCWWTCSLRLMPLHITQAAR